MSKISTKIYEAYRFPKERLNDFIDFIDEKILPDILEYGNELFDNLTEEGIKKALKEKDVEDINVSELFKREMAFDYYIKKAINGNKRDIADLSASYNFWIRGDYVYTIPYIEDWLYEDFDYPEWVEDYSYWNNADKPEDISEKKWGERRELWNKINNNWDKGRLVHNIMTSDGNRWYRLKTYIRKQHREEG